MPSTKVIIGLVVAVLLVLSLVSAFVMRRPKSNVVVREESPKTPPPPPPPPTKPPTQPPTQAPTTSPSQQTVVYPDYGAAIIPPMVPTIPYPVVMQPSFILVPGSNFPGLVGKRRDEASTYIITRYPRLVVRAVPMGTPVTYEVRKDRVTLSYDPYTNRVVNARIG